MDNTSYQVDHGRNAPEAKRTLKDSVFRSLFEDPVYLRQLYLTIHPEDVNVTESDIHAVTIRNILLDQLYNDLGFRVGDRLLILVEAQSTWSVNIIVRILMYLTETWKEYIHDTQQSPFSSKRLSLPVPEFYVIYTGENRSVRDEYTLAQEFLGGQDEYLNVKVRVLQGDPDSNDIISQYVGFTRVYNDQTRIYGRTRQAVLETVRICKDQGLLRDYLEARDKEVYDMWDTIFSQEYATECYGREKYAEGRTEGLTQGRAEEQQNSLRMICNMVANGDLSMAAAVKNAAIYGVTNEADLRRRAKVLGIKL